MLVLGSVEGRVVLLGMARGCVPMLGKRGGCVLVLGCDTTSRMLVLGRGAKL